MSPATGRARPPGEAPQPFCEHCGTSVEVAKLGPWVGLGHCPSCDTYSCRWCWTEAAESCPECGLMFGVVPASALPATEAIVATSASTEALAAGAVAANALVAEKLAVEDARAGAAAGPLSGTVPAAITTVGTKRVPLGIGVAVLAAAIFAMILGNPFDAGGVGGVLDATNGPSIRSSFDASEPTGSSDAGGGSVAPATSEPAATDDPANQPGGAPGSTTRPAATPTLPPGVTPAPPTATPPRTPLPTPTSAPTPTPTSAPTPTPAPTPPPTPTPAPTPTPPPACQTVPNMVGLTVAKARNAWNGAGFTGSFTAPTGPAKAIVTSQSQPAGACLPPDTGITVTT